MLFSHGNLPDLEGNFSQNISPFLCLNFYLNRRIIIRSLFDLFLAKLTSLLTEKRENPEVFHKRLYFESHVTSVQLAHNFNKITMQKLAEN